MRRVFFYVPTADQVRPHHFPLDAIFLQDYPDHDEQASYAALSIHEFSTTPQLLKSVVPFFFLGLGRVPITGG
jgi:hypothetical protein